jgi:hypothetical protein
MVIREIHNWLQHKEQNSNYLYCMIQVLQRLQTFTRIKQAFQIRYFPTRRNRSKGEPGEELVTGVLGQRSNSGEVPRN